MKAKEVIDLKKSLILYKKVGKKYIPFSDPFAHDGLREGWWLIKVEGGCTSMRSIVYPDKAEIHAAIRDKADEIVSIIRDASAARPVLNRISDAASIDWGGFILKHGKEFSSLQYPSFDSNAKLILEALTNERI